MCNNYPTTTRVRTATLLRKNCGFSEGEQSQKGSCWCKLQQLPKSSSYSHERNPGSQQPRSHLAGKLCGPARLTEGQMHPRIIHRYLHTTARNSLRQRVGHGDPTDILASDASSTLQWAHGFYVVSRRFYGRCRQ